MRPRWVYTCCENIAKRKISYDSRCDLLTETTVVVEIESEEEKYGELYRKIKHLDDDSRKIIELHYQDGYNFVEIAQKMGIASASVRQKHCRALKKIKF